MKTSELLRLARDKYLARTSADYDVHHKERMYICSAIWCAAYSFDIKTDARTKARITTDRISLSIKPHSTADEWLVANGHARRDQVGSVYIPTQAIYDYRHCWITAMIAEYEAKGD